MKISAQFTITLAILAVAASNPLVAAPITVVNPGFNGVYSDSGLTTLVTASGFASTSSLTSPTTSFGFSSNNVYVSGWTSNAPGNTYTGGVQWNGTYVSAPTYGFLNGNGRTMSQTLGGNTLAEGTYTLTLSVGKYQDPIVFDLTASLLAGSTALIPSSSSTPTPTSGTLLPWTYTFNVTSSHPLIGQTLGLQLEIPNSLNNGAGAFDDVGLDFVVIPEPSTVAMLLMATTGALLVFRRRRVKA